MTDPIDWTLVTVAPNTEPKVKAALERHEFPHHMFRHRETIMPYGRRIPISAVHVPELLLRPVGGLWPVAARIDQVGAGPVRETVAPSLPAGVVDRSSRHVLAPTSCRRSPKPPIRPGEPVMIGGAGPMAGQSGGYSRLTTFGRCLVELTWGRAELEGNLAVAGRPCDVGHQA